MTAKRHRDCDGYSLFVPTDSFSTLPLTQRLDSLDCLNQVSWLSGFWLESAITRHHLETGVWEGRVTGAISSPASIPDERRVSKDRIPLWRPQCASGSPVPQLNPSLHASREVQTIKISKEPSPLPHAQITTEPKQPLASSFNQVKWTCLGACHARLMME